MNSLSTKLSRSRRRLVLVASLLAFSGAGACGDEDTESFESEGGAGGEPASEAGAGSGREKGGEGGGGLIARAGAPSAGGAEGEDEQSCEGAERALRFEPLGLKGAGRGTDFVFLPSEAGELRLLVAAFDGKVHLVEIEDEGAAIVETYELPDPVYEISACGLTNVILDPEFETNRFIYVSHCLDEEITRLMRYTWSEAEGINDGAVIVETQVTRRDEWHRFGSMGFEEDGETMWVLVGDHFHQRFGQDATTKMGSVIRIVPNREPNGEGHTPAKGNLAELLQNGAGGEGGAGGGGGEGGASASPEPSILPDPTVYAIGLRSPWRGTRDFSGRLFVGDVGLEKYEEVNLVTRAGQNFGWAVHEGPCTKNCDGFTDPIAYYGRSGDEPYAADDPDTVPATKRAIWVGEIYEAPAQDRYCGLMDQVVVFGDLFTGWVRALRADAEGRVTLDQNVGHLTDVTAWRTGPDGYAYALTLNGELWRARLAAERH